MGLDAFGKHISHTGTTLNDFLFTGQPYDANVGFYYLRARYYQPDTGRFTALDPFMGDPYAPASLHKYLYVGSDPINRIDPSGMFFDAVLTVSLVFGFAYFATYKNPLQQTSEIKDCYRPLDAPILNLMAYHRFLWIEGRGYGLGPATFNPLMLVSYTVQGKIEYDSSIEGWGVHCISVTLTKQQKTCLLNI